MKNPFDNAFWTKEELPALLAQFALHADAAVTPPRRDVGVWMESACTRLGIDLEAIDLWGFRVAEKLRACSPAIVETTRGWLAIVQSGAKQLILLTPHLRRVRVTLESFRALLCSAIETKRREANGALLDSCGLKGQRREAALRALCREQSRYDLAGTLFQLRTPVGAPFSLEASQAGLFRLAAAFCLAHLADYALGLAAWWMLGGSVLKGHLDKGVFLGWVLLLATTVPFRMLTSWSQGKLAIRGGGLLKQRLLAGALKLAPEEVRHQGAGQFLAQCAESEMVETLALSGGLMSLLALIEILLASVVLWLGAGGGLQTAGFLFWTVLAILAARAYWKARQHWTSSRLSATHGLVERMTGHRTRLAQQPPADWHSVEDRHAADYEARSRAMDTAGALLSGLMPAAWLVLGLAALAPAFLGTGISPDSLSLAAGGIVLGWRALKRLCTGASQLAGAAIAWQRVKEILLAAARKESAGFAGELALSPETPLSASGLSYVRKQSARAVLEGVDLEIRRGERVLIEGESGGGKSTLVSLLAGLRDPSSGLVLSGGLDRFALGDSLWRRRIAAAPQYHENHIFGGTLAYNLLMGRQWPAKPEQMREAQAICEKLGLGPLLEKMPGGLMQIVGETGWQLSQGERSRVFMARALLQAPDVVVLDESFAALDPETVRASLECALQSARTLLVVAHP